MSSKKDIVVNTSNIKTVRPVVEWQNAATSGNLGQMIKIAMTLVEAWPYDGDPKSVDSYYDLSPQDFKQVLQVVGDALADLFR